MTVIAKISNDVTIELVDPNTPSYMNRPIDKKRCESYIKTHNGWNPALAGTIDVAELPDGRRYRWDGGHRCYMFISTHEEGEKILAHVTKVQTEEEISDLYIKRNKEAQKSLSQESLFVHKQKDEKELVTLLGKAKLSVTDGLNVVGNPQDPSVKIQGIRTLLKKVKESDIIFASNLINASFPNIQKIPVELLSGVAISIYNVGLKPQFLLDVVSVLKDLHKRRGESVRNVHSFLKKSGGSVNTRGSESVALGLLKELKYLKTPGVTRAIRNVEAEIKLR